MIDYTKELTQNANSADLTINKQAELILGGLPIEAEYALKKIVDMQQEEKCR